VIKQKYKMLRLLSVCVAKKSTNRKSNHTYPQKVAQKQSQIKKNEPFELILFYKVYLL